MRPSMQYNPAECSLRQSLFMTRVHVFDVCVQAQQLALASMNLRATSLAATGQSVPSGPESRLHCCVQQPPAVCIQLICNIKCVAFSSLEQAGRCWGLGLVWSWDRCSATV